MNADKINVASSKCDGLSSEFGVFFHLRLRRQEAELVVRSDAAAEEVPEGMLLCFSLSKG